MENETTTSAAKTHRLIIAEWVTLISVFVGCFLFLFHKIEKQSERTDSLIVIMNEQFAKQTERSDHLYQMFIDLIKEGRNG